jgi:hypothetical protein
MKSDSYEYYCFQWCGRMRWVCVRNTTGRDRKLVLARRLGRKVTGRVDSWGNINSKRFLCTTVQIRNLDVYRTLGKGYLKYTILTIHHSQGKRFM